MSNTNREAFEAWVTKFRSNVILRRFENGEYVSAVTENYFNVWQAALAQANVNEQSQAQQTESKWNQIETAPKDGSEVILMVKSRAGISKGFLVGHYMQGGHCIEDHPPIDSGWYFWNGRMFDKASEPTHWMPLPPAPIECNEKPEGE